MCGKLSLSPVYAGCALSTAVLALALGWWASGMVDLWSSAILALGLSWLAWIDIDRLLLPDILTLGLLLLGLGFGALEGVEELTARLLGAAAGYVVLAGTAVLYKRVRGVDGLGGGDAKLLAAGGGWLGWTALPLALLVASLSGILYALAASLRSGEDRWRARIPFGPFLALGIWVGWTAPAAT